MHRFSRSQPETTQNVRSHGADSLQALFAAAAGGRPPSLADPRLEAMIEHLPVGVGLTDLEGRLVAGNSMLRRYVPDVIPSRGRGRGDSWRGWTADGTPIPSDEWPGAKALRGQSVQPGCEMLYRDQTGRESWMLVSAEPLRDEHGNVQGAVLFVQDIHERKMAELALHRRAREQAALYHLTDALQRAATLTGVCEAALDSINEALGSSRASVLLFDEAGVMRFVAWRGLSEAYRAAVDGHSPWRRGEKDPKPVLVGDVAAAELPEGLRAVIAAEGIGAVAFIPLLLDGELVGKFMVYMDGPHHFDEAEVRLALTIGGQLAFGVERVRALESLRRAEAKYRTTFEVASVGQAQVDAASGRFILVNDAFCRITGRSREELLSLTTTDITHPEDRAWDVPLAESFLRGDRDSYSVEKRYVQGDGRVVWARVNAALVRDSRGRPVHTVAVVEDITDGRVAFERARRLNTELERFASVASHDLKEPLRGMSLQAQFVLEDEPSLGQASKERLERIIGLSARLAEMIKGLLDYARSGGERRDEACDLTEAARRAVDKLADTIAEGRASVHIAGPLPIVRGDPTLLERVLANLIVNAIKYNHSSEKRVEIGVIDGAVYVRDNGVGIATKDQESVFRIFGRCSRESLEGVGLGLALVKNIVEAHGGWVSLRSVPGEGSTFLLHFPADLSGAR